MIPEGVKDKLVNTVNNISIQICGYKRLHLAATFAPHTSTSKPRIKMLTKVTGGGIIGSNAPVPLEITADKARENKAVVTRNEMYASALRFCCIAGYLGSRRHDARSRAGSKKTNLAHTRIRLLACQVCKQQELFCHIQRDGMCLNT